MATCKGCGKGGLEWRQENERWWLYDPATDMAHMRNDCDEENARRRAQEIADTVERPVIKRGDRVVLKGFTGTVEALTKPYEDNKIDHRWERCRGNRRGEYRTVIAAVKGDVFALIKWDDQAAYARFRKWINTRNLTLANGA